MSPRRKSPSHSYPKVITHKKKRYRAIQECQTLSRAASNVRHLKKAGVPATRRKHGASCHVVYFRRRGR